MLYVKHTCVIQEYLFLIINLENPGTSWDSISHNQSQSFHILLDIIMFGEGIGIDWIRLMKKLNKKLMKNENAATKLANSKRIITRNSIFFV